MADRQSVEEEGNNRIKLKDLPFLSAGVLIERLGGIFENSPWVVQTIASNGPYANVEELHRAMAETVYNSPEQRRVALFSAHPELAGKEARAGKMTESSTQEQSVAGLDSLNTDEYARFDILNKKYREKFGFPFIVAVRDHTKQSIFEEFEKRLTHNRKQEMEIALQQVLKIARFRLDELITDD